MLLFCHDNNAALRLAFELNLGDQEQALISCVLLYVEVIEQPAPFLFPPPSPLPPTQWILLEMRGANERCAAGLGLLARACLLLRLEDAKAGLLYSQYHGIMAFCTAQHQM